MGQFAWNTVTGQWRWDRGMFELHGYPPGAVAVSNELVLSHKHEEHRAHAAGLLRSTAGGDHRFSNYHDIVDATGRRRTVITIGVSRSDSSPSLLVHRFARGFMVDVTQDDSNSTERAIRRARRRMAPISQSMGLLMGSLGIAEDEAFEMLSRVSQHHNVKLATLSERFMAAAVASAGESPRELVQVLVDEATGLVAERALQGQEPRR